MHKPLRCAALVAGLLLGHFAAADDDYTQGGFFQRTLTLKPVGTFETGIFDDSAAEIVAYDAHSRRVFVVNGSDGAIDVLDIRRPSQPVKVGTVDVSDLGEPTSVAVKDGLVAVAVDSGDVSLRGNVVFLKASNLKRINTVEAGFLPDAVTFSPNGRYVVVSNEGEPNDEYTIDPEGSVSIIDLRRGAKRARVRHATFDRFNSQVDELVASGVRVFGPNATLAQDLEPEFAAVDARSRFAYVTLQENNALAIVNLRRAKVVAIKPLGFKDHSLPENQLDASNRDDAINIRNWPVFGMYQPDSIASFRSQGKTFLITANEGDARDYDGFSEEERMGDLPLDPTAFPDAATLQLDENLGRLNSTTTLGDDDGDGDFDRLFAYGARSFSIWSSTGELVFDSGSELEYTTANLLPDDFNSTNDENGSFDARSDDKGPEPEGVAVGRLLGRTYAFIGLERIGGIVVYDVSDPYAPIFQTYVNNRDFAGDAEAGTAGDLGPEGLTYVPWYESPNFRPLLIVGNEVSGTTTIFEIGLSF